MCPVVWQVGLLPICPACTEGLGLAWRTAQLYSCFWGQKRGVSLLRIFVLLHSSLHLTLPFGTSCVKLVVKGWSETGKGFGKFMGQLDTFYLSPLWHLVAFHFHPQIRYATWLINSGAEQQLAWWKWVITFHFPWLEFWLPLTWLIVFFLPLLKASGNP